VSAVAEVKKLVLRRGVDDVLEFVMFKLFNLARAEQIHPSFLAVETHQNEDGTSV